MQVPHQYPYNPPLKTILLFFGLGFLWIALDWLPSGHLPGFSLVGFIPIVLALILGVRWAWVERYLVLDKDSMVLPTGLFEMRTAKIEYATINRVWRQYIRFYETSFVLRVATENGTFMIKPFFLPDKESYPALEEFLKRKAHENNNRSGRFQG